MPDVVARGFPRDLDDHPALAWMGDDWVTYVFEGMLDELRRQDPGTMLSEIACLAPPTMETAASGSGQVQRVTLRLELGLVLTSGDGADHRIEGRATVAGPDPVVLAFEIARPHERLVAVLRAARDLVVLPDNDFMWSSWEGASDAVEELDHYLAALDAGPVRAAAMAGIFSPTGPFHELSVSSGWANAASSLADRFDVIRTEAADGWSCATCGAEAGTIRLGEGGAVQLHSPTTGSVVDRIDDVRRLELLWDAIAAGSAELVFAFDSQLAPWWCPACASCYCGDHWSVDVEASATRGRCPAGHDRVLAGFDPDARRAYFAGLIAALGGADTPEAACSAAWPPRGAGIAVGESLHLDTALVLQLDPPAEAGELAAAWDIEWPLICSSDVHQQIWFLCCGRGEILDGMGRPLVQYERPRGGRWEIDATLTGRPQGEMPTLRAPASPAYEVGQFGGLVAHIVVVDRPPR